MAKTATITNTGKCVLIIPNLKTVSTGAYHVDGAIAPNETIPNVAIDIIDTNFIKHCVKQGELSISVQ